MRQRVPRQASTKWWFLLAALLAIALTWFQQATTPRPERAPRAPAPEASDPNTFELELAP